MKFRALLTIGILASTMLVSGCASTPSAGAERLVVQAATLRIIETAAQPAQKAQRVMEAAALTRTMLLDEYVTVGALHGALMKRLNERDLAPSEKLVALSVIGALASEVEARVGSGILSPASIVSVNTVLDWVEDAAGFYVPVTP